MDSVRMQLKTHNLIFFQIVKGEYEDNWEDVKGERTIKFKIRVPDRVKNINI